MKAVDQFAWDAPSGHGLRARSEGRLTGLARATHDAEAAPPAGFEPTTVGLEEPREKLPRLSDAKPVTASRPIYRPLPLSWSNGTEILRYFEGNSACASARNSRVTASTAGRL